MTTIRPNVYPQQAPLGGQRDDAAKLAAQQAFFQALRGQSAPAPAAPAASAQAAEPAQAVNRVAQTNPAEAPQRILRPGSLLDIRV